MCLEREKEGRGSTVMRELDQEQIAKIISGAKMIASALGISEKDVFAAIRGNGNITSKEEFILGVNFGAFYREGLR